MKRADERALPPRLARPKKASRGWGFFAGDFEWDEDGAESAAAWFGGKTEPASRFLGGGTERVGESSVAMCLLSALFLAAAACSPPSRRDDAPATERPRAGDDRIVAFVDGAPVTWRAVADRAMNLELRRNIDLYVRWKVIEDRRRNLGIENTPEELGRRADAMIAQYKKSQGEEVFRRQLEAEGYTEASYRDFVVKNRLFAEKLTLEKMVRYSYFAEGWVETDRMLFADPEDGKSFLARAKEKGYDKAAEETKEARGRVTRRPREIFLRDLAPADLPPATVERIFSLPVGGLSDLEQGRTGASCIILVRKRQTPRPDPYDSLREPVLQWILEEPLSDAELAAWIDLQVKRSRVEYSDRRD
ncbi:MAG: hypothetical protein HYY17_04015 [Planctomycetes bacterium]|nr:hypothetical protein [Planctomycetota bacterium]